MHRTSLPRPILALLLLCALWGTSCKDYATNKLQRQMKPFAKQYLAEDQVKDYSNLIIKCVDTVTEVGYAQLTLELLGNMEAANSESGYSPEVQNLMLKDIHDIQQVLEALLSEGILDSKGVLLYMVTASYLTPEQREREFIFFVNADKKSLHTLDPFGDNLVLQ